MMHDRDFYSQKESSRLEFDILKNLQNSKRSQVSVYIVISLIIIGGTFFYLYTQDYFRQETRTVEVDPIYSFVRECISEVGEEGIYMLGRQGGYFITPDPNIEDIPYYQYEDKDYWPSRKKVEEQLGLYMDSLLPFCTDGFSNYPEFSVEEKSITTKVTVDDSQVYFSIVYPLSITKDSQKFYLKNFDNKINVRLGLIHSLAGEIIHEQMKKTTAVCATCLYSLSEKNKLHINVMDMNETNTLLFVIRDEQSKILDDDFHYYFINKLTPVEKNG